MCPKHYSQVQRGSVERSARPGPNPECAVSHCRNQAETSAPGSLCRAHYQIKYRGVDPESRILRNDGKTRAACWVMDCSKAATTLRLCNYHARRARTGKLEVPAELGVRLNPPCAFEGCSGISVTKGLCHSHYCQLQEGRGLKEVRDYGKYTRGEHICARKDCRRPAASQSLCDRHASSRTQYGLTVEEYLTVWENPVCQNPRCGAIKRLHMDHDHVTGKFRALLCSSCNTSLGHLKEDSERILGLAEYIRGFQSPVASIP